MHRKQLWSLARMSLGSVLGIIGFGTLSMGFVHLSGVGMLVGLLEILAGAFVALGVMTPLRKRKARA
jgi:uncharacterized membrane protein YphA (DoxX/SURF4 family)